MSKRDCVLMVRIKVATSLLNLKNEGPVKCDFVALGENRTCNFVAQLKLSLNATASLCLEIKVVVPVRARVRVRVRVRFILPRNCLKNLVLDYSNFLISFAASRRKLNYGKFQMK